MTPEEIRRRQGGGVPVTPTSTETVEPTDPDAIELAKVKSLRRIKELEAELGPQEPPSFGRRAWEDVKGLGSSFLEMANSNPVEMAAKVREGELLSRAQGGVPKSDAQLFLENSIGPLATHALQAYLNAPGGAGGQMEAISRVGTKEVSDRPVTAPLELLGILGTLGEGSAFARNYANASYRPQGVPLLEWKPERPFVKGEGFVMSEPAGPTEQALSRPRPTPPPPTPLQLTGPEAPKLLTGPTVGPEGPGQFVARDVPSPGDLWAQKQAETAARRQAVAQATEVARNNPAKAADAFRKLAEDMAGGKIGPYMGATFKMTEDVPVVKAEIATTKKGPVVKAPSVAPGATEIRNTPLPDKPLGASMTPVMVEEIPTGRMVTAQQRAGELATRRAVAAQDAIDRFEGKGQPPATKVSRGTPEPSPPSTSAPTIHPPEDNLIWMQGGLGVVKGALKSAGRFVPAFIKEARARVPSKAGQALMDAIEYVADPLRERLVAHKLEVLAKAGFRAVKGVEAEALLADRLEHKLPHTPLSQTIEGLFRSMWSRARAAGMDIGNVEEGYFRRQMKDEIAQPIFDDLSPLEARYKSLGITDEVISTDLKKLIKDGKLNEATAKVLQHLVDTRQVRSLAEAMRGLRRDAGQSLFAESGWEKTRKYHLPADIYERDARKVIIRYIESWGKRVAETEVFGAKGEKAAGLIAKVGEEGSLNEARFAQHVLDAWSGDIEFKKPLGPALKKWSNRWTAFAALSKIAFGFSTLKNVFQTVISTAEQAGWARTARGLYKMVQSPEHRAWVRHSGALNRLSLEALAGYVPPSKSARIAGAGLKYGGFTHVNIFNQYLAGTTAVDWIPELHDLANGRIRGSFERLVNASDGVKTARRAWAQDTLKRMGVDWKKSLTPDQLETGIYRFATDTQLQRNVVRDPLTRTDPRLRPLWALKGFGVRQLHWQYNLLTREAKLGNYFPLMRLGVGAGLVAAPLEQWLEKHVRALLSGEPPKESDKGPIKLYFQNLASLGTVSYLTDILAAENKLQFVEYAATPIQVSDLHKGLQSLEQVWRDADLDRTLMGQEPLWSKTAKEFAASRAKEAVGVTGSLPRELMKRFRNEKESEADANRAFTKVKEDLFYSAMHGDQKSIDRIYAAWQHNYPNRPITYEDIGPLEFADWLVKYHKIESRRDFRQSGYESPVPSTQGR